MPIKLAEGRAGWVLSQAGMLGQIFHRICIVALVLLGIAVGNAEAARLDVTDLRTWSAPDNTRMVLDLSGAPTYRVKRESNPPRLVVEVKGGVPRAGRSSWPAVDGRISGITMEGTAKGTRITIALDHRAPFKHFALPPYGDKPHRIVVDVLGSRAERISKAPKKPIQKAAMAVPKAVAKAAPPRRRVSSRPFVVVIDAGHGGEDPGAIGRSYRTREKDVVLKIARYLHQELAKMDGIHPKLTRKGDYFISLGRRVSKANQMGGDLFVSIHADSSKNRRTRGTHLYTLAPRSRQDRKAVRVARMENASDRVGGVQAVATPMIFDKNGSPNNVVESRVLSHLMMDQLDDLNRNGRQGRRSQARFWVLKGKRPSILVETGFLSNKQDEKNLRSEKFQRQLAKRLALAIRDYRDSRATSTTFVYMVRRGDTLSKIASRYGVPVRQLAKQNRLRNISRLKAGQRLIIPGRGAPQGVRSVTLASTPAARPKSPAVVVKAAPAPRRVSKHHVRRGENLTRIAKRYGVRLGDLMSVNQLTSRSRLSVGQVLSVPAAREGDHQHIVGRGETLSGLASRFGISLSELARVNDLRTRSRLQRGQVLIIPGGVAGAHVTRRPPSRHKVGRGETLTGLATRFGVPLTQLARANGLSTRAHLKRGQVLTIPGDGIPLRPLVHKVRRGETLSGLAVRFGVPLKALARHNGLSIRAKLLRGQKLHIPQRARA